MLTTVCTLSPPPLPQPPPIVCTVTPPPHPPPTVCTVTPLPQPPPTVCTVTPPPHPPPTVCTVTPPPHPPPTVCTVTPPPHPPPTVCTVTPPPHPPPIVCTVTPLPTPTTDSVHSHTTSTPTTDSVHSHTTSTPTTDSVYSHTTSTPTNDTVHSHTTSTPTTDAVHSHTNSTPTTDAVHTHTTSTQHGLRLTPTHDTWQNPPATPPQNMQFPFPPSDATQNRTTSARSLSTPVPTQTSRVNADAFQDTVTLSSRNMADCLARRGRLYFSAYRVSITYIREVNQAGMSRWSTFIRLLYSPSVWNSLTLPISSGISFFQAVNIFLLYRYI